MTLNQRSTAILSHLVKTKTYVPVGELLEKFHISRRTIYYDIEKINDWLSEQDLPPVRHVRSAGFILDEDAANKVPDKLSILKTDHYEYSAKERKAWLAIYLMGRDTPLFLEDLMEKLRVSRNTTIEDLKSLKLELKRFALTLEAKRKSGYVIIGKEDDKRKALVHYLQHVLPNQNWPLLLAKLPLILNAQDDGFDLFDFEKMKAVERIISESEQELNVQFTDEFLYSLAIRLLLFCRRVSQGKKISIDPIEKEVLEETKEFQAAGKIAEKLSALFEVDFPEDEILYITKHLLSSRVQFSDNLQVNGHSDSQILSTVVTQMVTDFQKYACVFFENRQEIEKNLLLHVKPAYYRIKYGLEFESEMTESIKQQYYDIFVITKKCISHLEAIIGKKLNDHETALIAMHFGGWMKKVGVKPAARKKALLVCTNGVGTSRLLLHQLEGLFSTIDLIGSVSLREYKQTHYDVDFIISTIPLEEKEIPVFVVSPILTETEKESLLKKVIGHADTNRKQAFSIEALMEIIQKHASVMDKESLQQELKQYLYKPEKAIKLTGKPTLADLLKPEHIQIQQEAADWQAAIKTAAEPLLEQGFITAGYIEAMIDNLIQMGPYIVIAPKVAIPHARPEDGVHQLSMSLLRLSKPVAFSEKGTHDIQLVIVLAAIDGETHLKALSQLTEILSDKNCFSTLLQASSTDELFAIIADGSTE
ncbi:BglG family transcription antiterminator [Bacillus rubiinfantis]|uniref:BglG family transcription antiterminator n=1 Tax=Bacillus rubiinfantis TaxID=1499680 RepID=UPI0005A760EB